MAVAGGSQETRNPQQSSAFGRLPDTASTNVVRCRQVQRRWRRWLASALWCVAPPCPLLLQPDSSNVVPAYPDVLRDTRVGAPVRVRFVVDSNGRPVMVSWIVVDSVHDLFHRSIKNALSRWRFTLARRGGRSRRPRSRS
ncbi:energy transducer TonB [Gemmatimonas sp.]|uniref:energy transducer TonB n=1 Tax=Gemmatimonas sp. TaxID=1962908 RepID=UPI0033423697